MILVLHLTARLAWKISGGAMTFLLFIMALYGNPSRTITCIHPQARVMGWLGMVISHGLGRLPRDRERDDARSRYAAVITELMIWHYYIKANNVLWRRQFLGTPLNLFTSAMTAAADQCSCKRAVCSKPTSYACDVM